MATKDNKIPTNIKQSILVSILPTKEGFACTVLPATDAPEIESYAVALTIAHGMVKASVEEPDYIFDMGVEAMQETGGKSNLDFQDLINRRKERLH
jgi:hypothetical protein